jgi:L-rhamnose isomerase
VHNLWIPDGAKEYPRDAVSPRRRLAESLDAILAVRHPETLMADSLEGKLFGIGSESYVAGSYDFYLSYAVAKRVMLTVDNGHFHPTESAADKLSSVLPFLPGIFLHITRGIRWDSDHVPLMNDEVLGICLQLVRGGMLGPVRIAMDFFDASINRVGAYLIGVTAVLKSLLFALLEPADLLRRAEEEGDYYSRLTLQEQAKIMPFGAVWEYYCASMGVPTGEALRGEILRYERDVLSERG